MYKSSIILTPVQREEQLAAKKEAYALESDLLSELRARLENLSTPQPPAITPAVLESILNQVGLRVKQEIEGVMDELKTAEKNYIDESNQRLFQAAMKEMEPVVRLHKVLTDIARAEPQQGAYSPGGGVN